ncbi:hypothetical protein GmRootV118_31220 [Variovorax sp. V118]
MAVRQRLLLAVGARGQARDQLLGEQAFGPVVRARRHAREARHGKVECGSVGYFRRTLVMRHEDQLGCRGLCDGAEGREEKKSEESGTRSKVRHAKKKTNDAACPMFADKCVVSF